MVHDVIISYSSHDKAIADACCAALESQRIRCWIAPRDVLAGTEYGEAILHGIERSMVMLFVFSAKSNNSTYCRKEVERAVSLGKIIVPFRIEETLPSGAMSFFLGNTHWLDALTPPLELRIDELVGTIARLLGQSGDSVRESEIAEAVSKAETDAQRFERMFAERPDVIAEVEAESARVPPDIATEFERLLVRLEVSVPKSSPGYDRNSEVFNRVLSLVEKHDMENDAGRALVSVSRQPNVQYDEGRDLWQQYKRYIGNTAGIRDTIAGMGNAVMPLVCAAFRRMNSCGAHNDSHTGYYYTSWVEMELLTVMGRLRDFRALPFIADAALRHTDELNNHNDFGIATARAIRMFGVPRKTVDECFERLVGVTASEILEPRREGDRH